MLPLYHGCLQGDDEDEATQDIDLDEDCDFIDLFAAGYGEEDTTGPPLPENLAILITRMMQTRSGDEKDKALCDEILRPENVPMLSSPRVPPEIWTSIRSEKKSADLALSRLSTKIIKSMTATAKVAEGLNDLKPKMKGEPKDIIRELTADSLKSIQLAA